MKAFSFALVSALVLFSTVACEEVKFSGALMVNDGSGQNGDTGSGASSDPEADPKNDGPDEVTAEERASCLGNSTLPLEVIKVQGAHKEVEITVAKAVILLVRGAHSTAEVTLKKAPANAGYIFCAIARGGDADIEVESEAKLDKVYFSGRGFGNDLRMKVEKGGSVGGGHVELRGAFNDFRLDAEEDAGAIVCPSVDRRGFMNRFDCDDDD